ncbi:MAG: hypothetical protein JSV09_10085 [Thermoplasmata archaeon]|nr:MAG: hypothetical protein JSV09_10085 [Thermoplasmata archaeon]
MIYMKFGVVVCPLCRTARGTRLGAKTAVCVKCGKKIDLTKARIQCKVKTESELAHAVQEYNSKLI